MLGGDYLHEVQLRAVFADKGIVGRRLRPVGVPGRNRPGYLPSSSSPPRSSGLPLIRYSLDHGLSNALAGATNNHRRVLTRRWLPVNRALITMAMFTRGRLCPAPPWQTMINYSRQQQEARM